jgi:integrase/recombinase XerD
MRTRKIGSKCLSEGAAPGSLRALAEEHLAFLRVKNYSATTVESRRPCLRYFLEWCEARGILRPAELTRWVVESYQRRLFHYRKENGNPLSVGTQEQRLMAMSGFCRWLTRSNHLLYNPAGELEMPKRGRTLPRHVMTAREAEMALMQADTDTPLGIRDRALLELFYSTGIRRGELSRLKLHDLDWERKTLLVREGKGIKDRVVPVGERALAWLGKYRDEVRPGLVREPDEGYVFLTCRGQPIGAQALTVMARDYIRAAGLGKRGACHLWRHTMATLMLENGADIRFIQEMLGHAKLDTTQIYTRVSIGKLQQVHAATHPSATFGSACQTDQTI